MNLKVALAVLVLFLIAGAVFYQNSQNKPKVNINKIPNIEVSSESVSLEDSRAIIDKINASRTKSGLLEINFDQNLCAYAKRVSLLEEKNDARPGDPPIKNDIESSEVQKTYFSPYSSSLINLAFYKVRYFDLETVSKDFSSSNSSAMAVDTFGGCVGGIYSSKMNGWILNFVGGSK